jgi:hypothetical protein
MHMETVHGMVSKSANPKCRNAYGNAEPSFSMKMLLKV